MKNQFLLIAGNTSKITFLGIFKSYEEAEEKFLELQANHGYYHYMVQEI